MYFVTSTERKELFTAILAAKANFDPVIKDATNPYFKSKYESLNGVLDAVETALNNEGIILLQPSSTDGTNNFVTTRLEHVKTGQFVDSTLKLEKTGNMQEVGAATTYGRRQTLKGLLGLKAEDDDGNVASGKRTESTVAPQGSTFTKTPTTTTTTTKKGPGRPAKSVETTTKTETTTPKVANGFSGNGTNGKTVTKPVAQAEEEW